MNTIPVTNHEPNDNTLLAFQLKKFFTWLTKIKSRQSIQTIDNYSSWPGLKIEFVLNARRLIVQDTLRHPCLSDRVPSLPATECCIDPYDDEDLLPWFPIDTIHSIRTISRAPQLARAPGSSQLHLKCRDCLIKGSDRPQQKIQWSIPSYFTKIMNMDPTVILGTRKPKPILTGLLHVFYALAPLHPLLSGASGSNFNSVNSSK